MTQQEFQEKLEGILESAKRKESRIGREEIGEAFDGENLTPEQFQLIYEYLLSKKIVVEGYEKEEGAEEISLKPEDEKYLERYRQQLAKLRPRGDGEEERLLEAFRAGKAGARERLMELYLGEVADLACRTCVPEVSIADLIQEGNLQLVLAMDSLPGGSAAQVRRQLFAQIREAMEALIGEQKDIKSRDRRMVSRVEELKDTIAILKEEFGRRVYLDEVADYMHISEEEAEAILKLTGEEVPREDAE